MKRNAPNAKGCKGNPPSKWLSSMYSLSTKASPSGVTGFQDIDFPMMNSPRNSMYDDIFRGDTPQKWISSTISLRESPYGRIPEGFPQGCRSWCQLQPALGGIPPPTRGGGSVRNQPVQLVQVSRANFRNPKEVNMKAILREYKGMQGMYRGYTYEEKCTKC